MPVVVPRGAETAIVSEALLRIRARQARRGSIRDPLDFATRLLGRRLWAAESALLAALETSARIAVKACHSSGKTYTTALAVLYWVYRYPDGIAVTTAPTWTQVEKLLWGEIHRTLGEHRALLGYQQLNRAELRLGPTNYAIGISTNEGVRFQGWHGRVLICLDEAPGVKPEIWDAIEGIRAGGDVRVLALGNPTIAGGPFYDAFHDQAQTWKTFTISAFDTPNLAGLSLADLRALDDDALDDNPMPFLTTRRWVREKLDEWGEDHPLFQSRVLGEFPTESDESLIPLSWMERCRYQNPRQNDHHTPVVCGLDVAGPGDNETVLTVRADNAVLHQNCWPEADPREKLLAALNFWRRRVERINVDAAGIGYYLARFLQDNGYPTQLVNVGEQAKEPKRFVNQKAENFWDLRLRFQAGLVSGLADERTIGQLAAIRWKTNLRGQTEIESKDEMRRRGVKSPDRAESLMLAFAPDRRRQLRAVAPVSIGQSNPWGAPRPGFVI